MSSQKRYRYVVPEVLADDFDVTPRDLVTGLEQTTTSHGLPHIARAKGKHIYLYNIARYFSTVTHKY